MTQPTLHDWEDYDLRRKVRKLMIQWKLRYRMTIDVENKTASFVVNCNTDRIGPILRRRVHARPAPEGPYEAMPKLGDRWFNLAHPLQVNADPEVTELRAELLEEVADLDLLCKLLGNSPDILEELTVAVNSAVGHYLPWKVTLEVAPVNKKMQQQIVDAVLKVHQEDLAVKGHIMRIKSRLGLGDDASHGLTFFPVMTPKEGDTSGLLKLLPVVQVEGLMAELLDIEAEGGFNRYRSEEVTSMTEWSLMDIDFTAELPVATRLLDQIHKAAGSRLNDLVGGEQGGIAMTWGERDRMLLIWKDAGTPLDSKILGSYFYAEWV